MWTKEARAWSSGNCCSYPHVRGFRVWILGKQDGEEGCTKRNIYRIWWLGMKETDELKTISSPLSLEVTPLAWVKNRRQEVTIPSSATTSKQVVQKAREKLGIELSTLNIQENLFLSCHPALENKILCIFWGFLYFPHSSTHWTFWKHFPRYFFYNPLDKKKQNWIWTCFVWSVQTMIPFVCFSASRTPIS